MRLLGIVAFVLLSYAAPAFSQQCLHGPNEDATQNGRAAWKLIHSPFRN